MLNNAMKLVSQRGITVSEATRRAYGRALREFFQFAGMKHPAEVVPADVLLRRDRL